MLYIQFYLEEFRYVLSTKNVVEVVPYVKLNPIPHTENYIAGLFNYRGTATPVIDICSLFYKRPSSLSLSSRIIIIEVKGAKGVLRHIGVLVEKATETIKVDQNSFVNSGVATPDMPLLGPVKTDGEGLITSITPQEIFSHLDEDLLFSQDQSA